MLLIQPQCREHLLPLAIYRKITFFSENPFKFSQKQANFWTFGEIILIQSQCTANLLPLAVFKKLRIFLRKPNLTFKKEPTFQLFKKSHQFSCYPKPLFYRWRFLKKSHFFSKNPYISFNKNKFWTFWEVLLFHSRFTAKMLHFTIWKNSRILWENQLFFEQKPEYSTVLRNLTYSLAFYRKFATLSGFSKKSMSFSSNSPFFSIKRP